MTNPTAYKRLQAEIDELGDNIVDCSTQVHLPYLNAVLYVIAIKISCFLTKNCLEVMKASGYFPLYCRVYSVLLMRELVVEWLVQCELINTLDRIHF